MRLYISINCSKRITKYISIILKFKYKTHEMKFAVAIIIIYGAAFIVLTNALPRYGDPHDQRYVMYKYQRHDIYQTSPDCELFYINCPDNSNVDYKAVQMR